MPGTPCAQWTTAKWLRPRRGNSMRAPRNQKGRAVHIKAGHPLGRVSGAADVLGQPEHGSELPVGSGPVGHCAQCPMLQWDAAACSTNPCHSVGAAGCKVRLRDAPNAAERSTACVRDLAFANFRVARGWDAQWALPVCNACLQLWNGKKRPATRRRCVAPSSVLGLPKRPNSASLEAQSTGNFMQTHCLVAFLTDWLKVFRVLRIGQVFSVAPMASETVASEPKISAFKRPRQPSRLPVCPWSSGWQNAGLQGWQ